MNQCNAAFFCIYSTILRAFTNSRLRFSLVSQIVKHARSGYPVLASSVTEVLISMQLTVVVHGLATVALVRTHSLPL